MPTLMPDGRRADDPAVKRERKMQAGGRPRVTDAQKRRYMRLVGEGWESGKAAEACGFSRATATKLNREYKPQIRKMKGTPEPRPFDDLPPEGKRACRDPEYFSTHYLGLELPAWGSELERELLEAYTSDSDEYIVVNVHPGSGKSTIATFQFVAWVVVRERALGREPRVSLGHLTEAKAKWYIARLAKLFTTNVSLIEDFGRFRPERLGPGIPWSTTQLMVEPLDWAEQVQKEPTISAASYEGGVLSGRYTLIIWDDLLDKSNQTSVEQREKVVDTWERDFEGRLEPGGLMVLANARFGPEDLSHYLLSQREDGEADAPVYRRIIFPAHDEAKCRVYPDGSVTHHGDWPEGCILNTRRLSKSGDDEAAWRRLRHFMRNEKRFRLVWNQEDVDPSGSLAERAWFTGGKDSRGFEAPGIFDAGRSFGQLPERDDRPTVSAISVDPSAENFWAVSHFLAYSDRHFVIQGERRRLKPHELLYRENDGTNTGILEDMCSRAFDLGVAVTYVIVEERGFTKWVSQWPFIREWAQARGIALVPHDTNRVNKHDPEMGVRMLEPVYREARVSLPYAGYHEKLYSDQFAREACSYPEGQTSDLVMHHWFFVHRLPNLAVVTDESEDEPEQTPRWVRQEFEGGEESVPRWARELVSS